MRKKVVHHLLHLLGLGIVSALITVFGNTALTLACDPGSKGILVEAPDSSLNPLKAFVQGFAEREEVPGVELLLVHKGKIVFWEAYGYADMELEKPFKKDTVVFLASTTKPIAATAILTLVDAGILALDDPVSRFLPEFKTLTLEDGSQGPVPTIRQLLSHTSGWAGRDELTPEANSAAYDADFTLEESVKRISQVKLLARPGQRFSYGPLSFSVAGRVAEVASGKPFDQLIRENVFIPLGMTDTTFHPTPEQGERVAGIYKPAPWGGQLNLLRWDPDKEVRLLRIAYGLYSTARDVAVFLQMHLNQGTFRGCRVLSAESVAEMQKDQIGKAEIAYIPGDAKSYGLGWFRKIRSGSQTAYSVSHPGAFGSVGWIDHERELVGVLFTPMVLKSALPIHRKIRARIQDLIPMEN